MTSIIQPRWYQGEAEQSIYDYYSAGKTGNPIIALPTGTGKSIVIGLFCRNVLMRWPQQRIIVATHVKELIEQNFKTLLKVWPSAPAGIYSAGLGIKQANYPIVMGGVQSMVNAVDALGYRDLMLIDECHLVSDKENGMYGKIIAALRVKNPMLKVIGTTATKYRMGQGLLTEGTVFTDICYDCTTMEMFNRLMYEGYICPLIPKRTRTELDTTGVQIQNGDYVQNQLQAAVDVDNITADACREIVEQGHDRRSWLVFATGIKHAEHIAAILQMFGISAAALHSKLKGDLRDRIVSDFKSGALRCVVNNNMVTTGFDLPSLDLIAMLRPTVSTVLWIQMLGRGTRPSAETLKENCLVLDFARNTERLGPINDPVIPRKRIKGDDPGCAPVKICDQCGMYNHASARVCANCGYQFPQQVKITPQASTRELIAQQTEKIVNKYNVQTVLYNRYAKGTFPIFKVTYLCANGLNAFHEYVCFEHPGYAKKKAQSWWIQRSQTPPIPTTVDEALRRTAELRWPKAVNVWVNKKYPEVIEPVF